MDNNLYIKELKKGTSTKEIQDGIEKILLKSTNDLEWLKKGDKVLLKPALNSPDSYPATTSPLAIKVVKRVLEERGAIVIIADQSGMEHVVANETGVVKGSSKECYLISKMGLKEDNFISIEDHPWDSFKKIESPSWSNGFYVTKLVDEVDHIINLPRVSTHIQAGVTLGFKNMVGILREDSRLEFHTDGPIAKPIKYMAKKGGLTQKYQNEGLFFEKVVEISTAIKDKLRLTLFVADKIQVTVGPDKKVALFKSKQIQPKTGYIFASENPVATEIFAIDILIDEYKKLSLNHKLVDNFIKQINRQVKKLDKQTSLENPFIKHAISMNLGISKFKRVIIK